MWILLGIASSFFLGFHEIFKKVGVNSNAVIPVLLTGTISGALLFLPFLLISRIFDNIDFPGFIYIPAASIEAHLFFFIKSLIVSTAWIFSFISVKHLPVTLLAPVNATGPVWTLTGAMIIYGERLNFTQWSGVIIILIFYYMLTIGGKSAKKEDSYKKWLWFAFIGILFNSGSALLDKYLVLHFDRIAMQAWFLIYTSLIFGLIFIFSGFFKSLNHTEFSWRKAIPFIGVFLVIADFLYFKSLSIEGSYVSILIILRRASAILVFTAGALYFKEGSLRKRALILAGIFAGVVLIALGSN